MGKQAPGYVRGDPRRVRPGINVCNWRGIYASSNVPHLSKEERAYFGALFDGEGGFYLARGKYPFLDVANTEIELISVLLRHVRVGHVRLDTGLSRGHKLCLHWRLERLADVAAFLWQIKAYSIKAQAASAIIKENWGVDWLLQRTSH